MKENNRVANIPDHLKALVYCVYEVGLETIKRLNPQFKVAFLGIGRNIL